MSRFRYGGRNWEGRAWTASMPVVALGDQISAIFPARHATDGTVASKAHDRVSPSSDHRPHPFKGAGIVRALDVGASDTYARQIPELLRLSRDGRIKYVIFEGRIFNDDTWGWRDYDGANPHATHYHVSFNTFADEDSTPFKLGFDQQGGEEDMTTAKEIWEYPLPDMDDSVGTRGAVHALKQAWGFSLQAARDAAVARRLIEQIATTTLTQAQIEAIGDEVASELAERLAS